MILLLVLTPQHIDVVLFKYGIKQPEENFQNVCKMCGIDVAQYYNTLNEWYLVLFDHPVAGYSQLISETSDKCDVRFFGKHDRALVPKSCTQKFTWPPPTPSTKTTHWTAAIEEFHKYEQNINQMLYQIKTGGLQGRWAT